MARTGIRRGIDGGVSVAGTNLNLERWQVASVADDIPALGFFDVTPGAAFDIGTTGVVTTTLSCSGYWDANQNPHDNPPNIIAGAIISSPVYLYTSRLNIERFIFTEIRILQCQVNMELRTRADLAFVAKANSAFTYPGGTASSGN